MTESGRVHDATPEAVEALAKELQRVFGAEPPADEWQWEDEGEDTKNGYRAEARYVLAREAALVTALTKAADVLAANSCPAWAQQFRDVLAAHRAASAPKEPTLAEAVEAMFVSAPQVVYGTDPKTAVPLDADGVRLCVVRPAALEAVKSALARERQQVKP